MAQRVAEQMQLAGYKLTPPRLAVLTVLDETDEHLSRAQILERVHFVQPAIGRATVYRTLDLLIRLGVVRPIYLGEQNVCFTRADRGHHDIICLDCGSVVTFDECAVDELQKSLSQRLNFEIRGHLLEFYGLCQQCQGA